ncbi:hypothetical protein ACW73L_16000 [Methylolobus aquaticus]
MTFSRLFLLAAVGCLFACKGPFRVPGLSFSFPESAPGFVSTVHVPDTLSLVPSVDRRRAHLGEDVAGTGWDACEADTLPDGAVPKLVDQRLSQAIEASGLFTRVSRNDQSAIWSLAPEVTVFCSQTRGFIGRRVAGLVGLSFILRKSGKVVWHEEFQRVVTDADPEYSGDFVTTVEQAMRRTMADALRVVLRDALGGMSQSLRKEY